MRETNDTVAKKSLNKRYCVLVDLCQETFLLLFKSVVLTGPRPIVVLVPHVVTVVAVGPQIA